MAEQSMQINTPNVTEAHDGFLALQSKQICGGRARNDRYSPSPIYRVGLNLINGSPRTKQRIREGEGVAKGNGN